MDKSLHQLNEILDALGWDFTNAFTSSFYEQRSQKRKKTVKSSATFCALGICLIKAVCKMLVKLTPDQNICQIQKFFSSIP